MATSRKSASASKASAAKKGVRKKPAKKQLAKKPGARHHSKGPDRHPHMPKQIVTIDVRVVYRLKNGELKEMVLDTGKVFGITWDHRVHGTTLPEKNEIEHGKPPHAKGPRLKLAKCDPPKQKKMMKMALLSAGACCYWNGSRWICPNEFE